MRIEKQDLMKVDRWHWVIEVINGKNVEMVGKMEKFVNGWKNVTREEETMRIRKRWKKM